jgi:hypothetical protein
MTASVRAPQRWQRISATAGISILPLILMVPPSTVAHARPGKPGAQGYKFPRKTCANTARRSFRNFNRSISRRVATLRSHPFGVKGPVGGRRPPGRSSVKPPCYQRKAPAALFRSHSLSIRELSGDACPTSRFRKDPVENTEPGRGSTRGELRRPRARVAVTLGPVLRLRFYQRFSQRPPGGPDPASGAGSSKHRHGDSNPGFRRERAAS